jgi:hypothetical protein
MGIEEKSRMTYRFLQRKMRKYEELEQEIRQLREEVRAGGAPSEEQGEVVICSK